MTKHFYILKYDTLKSCYFLTSLKCILLTYLLYFILISLNIIIMPKYEHSRLCDELLHPFGIFQRTDFYKVSISIYYELLVFFCSQNNKIFGSPISLGFMKYVITIQIEIECTMFLGIQ